MQFANPTHILAQLRLRAGDRIADFGAGAGHFSFPAAQEVGAANVYAIDVRPEIAQRLQTTAARDYRMPEINTLVGDVEEPRGSTLTDASVDIVLLTNVLFQLEYPDRAIQEAARVLVPGGRVLLMDWCESFAGLGPQAEDVIPEARARELAEAAGLQFEQELDAGDRHYALVYQKRTRMEQ